MRILIGYDGSECADAALHGLAHAGLPAEVEALVVVVAEVWLPEPPEHEAPQRVPASVARARERAHQVLERSQKEGAIVAARLRDRFPGWRIESTAIADSPAWGLLKQADRIHPDLILVGSQGHSKLGRLILGSVSQKIMTEARCSVRIARSSPLGKDEPERIVIGYDGSHDSERAVRIVAERQWPEGSTVHLVSAVDHLLSATHPPIGTEDAEWGERAHEEELHWIEVRHRAAIDLLERAGLTAVSRILEGDPKRVIPDEAESWGAGSIFLGARGLTTLERFLLGSVSSAVAARSQCSVEVVRAPAWSA